MIAAWLNASQRSRVGVGMKRSARIQSAKRFRSYNGLFNTNKCIQNPVKKYLSIYNKHAPHVVSFYMLCCAKFRLVFLNPSVVPLRALV